MTLAWTLGGPSDWRQTRYAVLASLLGRADRLADPADPDPDQPVLLAVSDNGAQMTSGSTREFMALHAIATHFGRPGVPTDQAPIESFLGHVKTEWPQLETIENPAALAAELDAIREQYRGRDGHCWPPPAQIPACASNALGS